MIPSIHARLRRWRRRLSRSEWLVKLLGLPHIREEQQPGPGLILIQIDGLARPQFERALREKSMPFLQHLLRDEEYNLTTFYSGQPSSTPAVQGELFYGVRTAVPSWGFRRENDEQAVTMMQSEAAAFVQEQLESRSPGLLVDGSAYSDIYTGGAQESHFCASRMGWGDMLKNVRPIKQFFILLIHAFVILRVLGLVVIELAWSVLDLIHGILSRYELLQELINIPARVGVVIAMREIQTRGAMLDIVRGVPIIHLNFLGYDEQAHRRGPSSNFAHWTLKGIDGAIKRIWRTAQRAEDREYKLWVYSDHGQEDVVPYYNENERTVQEAVAAVFDRKWEEDRRRRDRGIQLERAHLLGGRRTKRVFKKLPPPSEIDDLVVAKGPTGHIYAPTKLSATEENRLARALVKDARIPIVMAKDGGRSAKVWTEEGRFSLPEDAAKVLGEDHPLLEAVTQDLIDVVHHAWAGSFLILGWRPNAKPLSFPMENGSHAGPGKNEVQGFALLPREVSIARPPKGYIRPLELRAAAMRLRQFGAHCPIEVSEKPKPTAERTLRIMTYNVHGCVGMDGKLSLDRLVRLIRQYEPDVVALQELDVHRSRSGRIHQAQILAHELEMAFHFHPAMHLEEEQYGDAILTRLPMRLVKAAPIPSPPRVEPRGALWVELSIDGNPVQLINTHFGLGRAERIAQARHLLGPDWLGHPKCTAPAVLCGDFNSMPRSETYRILTTNLSDTRTLNGNGQHRGTFMGLWHLDYILISPDLEASTALVPCTSLARMASDHLPVIADLRLREPKVVLPPSPLELAHPQ
ncbi:MAG: endonuclease/exonuclease/phosphatase family protein [FCB group bacterium]|jgi:endonuclease/exonuclease/phosphatase family metal-dependent hydrolase|nr:endonuclease/exonuclease/phosphatase family protein [FCB group bacterium]